MYSIIFGQYLGSATRHIGQALAKRVRFESNFASLGHFVEALPECARVNTDAVQMSCAFTIGPDGTAKAYFHYRFFSIETIA